MELIASLWFGLTLALLLSTRCDTELVYFQQEEYDDKRFFTAWKNVRLFDVVASLITLLLLFIGWMFQAPVAALVLSGIAYLLIAWREKRYTFKKPLVNTARVRRIRGVSLVMLLLLALVASLIPLVALLALQCVPLSLVLANKMLQPAQQRVNDGFINEARGRLATSRAIPVGVTGSFGKTTVKHMLAEMLSIGGPVFYSRGSINTVLGLTRHIRQRLQPAHKYFVAEMGAYQIGSIDRLCEFVKPQYGIVTAVGEAHAERFGGIENTAKAKSELAAWVCQHGNRLVTTEAVIVHQPFSDLQQRHPDKFVVVGDGDHCDVRVIQSELLDGKWQIELDLGTGGAFVYSLPLLGEHNILNSALAVALIAEMESALLPRLAKKMAELEQVAHRLELKENDGEPVVLDDAYNSNEKGFTNAVEVLNKVASDKGGRAIVVTPGIAELGHEHDEVHRRLGAHCGELCHVVVVVNPSRIPTFTAAIEGTSAELIEVASLAQAREYLASIDLIAEDVILYENDLPDLLEEKRLL